MNAHYEPEALRRLAEQTHAQARTALVGGIIGGMVTGSLFGYAASLMFATSTSLLAPGMAVGAVLGVVMGRRRAMELKLKAQMALCQIQIEENTRKPTGS